MRRIVALIAILVGASAAIPVSTVASLPPLLAAPAPVVPEDGSSSPAHPVFTWKEVAGALRYDVKVRRTPDGEGCGGTFVGTRGTCDWLAPGTYTWTVTARGRADRSSPASTARTFTVQSRFAAPPPVIGPATGSTFGYPTNAMLRWDRVPGAVAYIVEVASDAVFSDGETYSTSREAMPLPVGHPNRNTYWRVRAEGYQGRDSGPWSPTRTYRVDWTAAPTLTAPPDTATVGEAVLTWAPVAGSRGYRVEVATDSAFANLVAAPTPIKPWAAIPGLVDGTYHWRVRAQNVDLGWSPWSATRRLTIDDAAAVPPMPVDGPLDVPVLTYPYNGATGVVPEVSPLRWTPVNGTIGYDVEVVPFDQDWNWADGAPNAKGPPILPTLQAGTRYKWRVRANATNGLHDVSDWSPTRNFTTPTPIEIDLTGPPEGAYRTNEDLLFEWQDIAAAPLYWVDVAPTPDFTDAMTIEALHGGRAVSRNILAPGVWYWRVRGGRDSVQATSPTRMLRIVDKTPPVGWARPFDYADVSPIGLEFDADDAITSVTHVAVSTDAASWTTYPYDATPTWSLTTPAQGGSTPGVRTIWMKWRDAAGNWSAPARTVFMFKSRDTTPPTVTTPRANFVTGTTVALDSRLDVALAWTSTDAKTGVARHEVRRSIDGDAASTVGLDIKPPTTTVNLPTQHDYRFAVRAVDEVGNESPWSSDLTFRPSRYNDTNSKFSYTGTWTKAISSSYLGGSVRWSRQAGAKATFSIAGRAVAWVASRGPDRGKAEVYVNGAKVATVDLYSASAKSRQVVWTTAWNDLTVHKVTVKVLGTSGRPRVDVDAFVVGSPFLLGD